MNAYDQTSEITNSLKTITSIFHECEANYRIVGSILIVAYKQTLFRHIGDIDIILDTNYQKCVFKKLKELGFQLEIRHWLNFYWYEAKKDNYLGFTFLLVGEFKRDYFSYSINSVLELRFQSQYIEPTPYSFDDIKFIGIPVFSVVAGIQHSLLNPKRKRDQEIMRDEMARFKSKSSANQIQVYVLGIKIPYLYEAFSAAYNMYGGIRVQLGKSYESW